MDPDYIAREIAKYEALIEQCHQKIEELQCLAVFNDEGEITSYADWAV